MKKLFIAGAILLAVNGVNAQHLSLGPTAGFGHSWGRDDNSATKNKFHPAYNVGAKLVYSTLSHFGFSADVKFSGEGGTIETMSGSTKYKVETRANFIRVPLQAIYFFGKYGDKIRPKVSLGPSLGFMVGGKSKAFENDKKIGEGDTKDAVKGFDLGANVAAGANFRIKEGVWLNADVTYYHGLVDISKAAGNAYQSGVGLNIGVLFPIGK